MIEAAWDYQRFAALYESAPDLRRSPAGGSPTCGLAQVPPADLDIPILGQLTPLQLSLSAMLSNRVRWR